MKAAPAILILLTMGTAATAQVRFAGHTVATGLKGGYQVIAADINGDGRLDLVALASGMPELVWYENPGWERHVIVGGRKGMINVAAWDTDGDGIPELALAEGFSMNAAQSEGRVSLLEHNGDPRQQWKIREIDRLATSHRLRWADFEGKGRKVLVNAPLTGARARAPEYRDRIPIVFYRPGEWTRQPIDSETQGVLHGIYVADWDGRKRDVLLAASFEGIHIYRPARHGAFKRERLTAGDPAAWPASGSSDVAVGRLGKERYLAAIEPWHGNEVTVYARHGGEWRRNVIDTSLVDGHTAWTGDFDGDGRDEVVAGFRGPGRSVYIYRAEEKAGGKWTRQTLDDGGIAAAACAVADLNGDGRLDVACIGSATANLKWYENLGK
jgi:hypothetical protein